MELIFIRHGHAEHLLDYPNRLNSLHPGLTEYGRLQVNQLSEQFKLLPNDLIFVSPTKRTIETAFLLAKGNRFFISPLVGPRMFPQNPDFPLLICDQIYSKDEVTNLYNSVTTFDWDRDCWKDGINRIDAKIFESYAMKLLDWCKQQQKRTIIISHDGTITNYRILLGEHGLTRSDFLGEAGVYRTEL